MKKMLLQGLTGGSLGITFLYLAIYVSVRNRYAASGLLLREVVLHTCYASLVVLGLSGTLLHDGIFQF